MYSLRSKKAIHMTFQEGVRAYAPWAVLHARRRTEETATGPRLGVIASKRVGGAVARNRARRLLRETSRVVLRCLSAPWDLLLVARPEVLETSFAERRGRLEEMFRKVGVLGETDRPEAATRNGRGTEPGPGAVGGRDKRAGESACLG